LLYHLQQVVQPEPHPSHKARICRQIAAIESRLPRLAQQRAQLAAIVKRQRVRLGEARQAYARLSAWLAQLEADNAGNPNAPVCVCRADAGFCSGPNLTWLIEMGYQIETKASSGKITQALTQRCGNGTRWTRIGDNAEMTAWGDYYFSSCPYPLVVGLERFTRAPRTRTQRTQLQHGVLILYRDTPAWPTQPSWFTHYNHRQTIEAGNKQTKTVHHVQHLMSRAKHAIEVQVLLTELACNLTHFIQPWLRAAAEKLTPRLAADLHSPKTMVRILANSAARVQRTPCSTSVVFAASSSLPDVKLCLHGLPLHQLNLGLFYPMQNAP
jgi:hypothetical protein